MEIPKAYLHKSELNMTTMKEIISLMSVFTRLTGMEVNPRIHERSAYEFIQAYGDEAEKNLELVVRHIQNQNRKGDFKLSLRFDKLMNDLERTDGILAEARAVNRNRPIPLTPKEQVLASFRGSPEPTQTGSALTVGEILAKIKP